MLKQIAKYMTPLIQAKVSEINKHLGILCLTEDPSNLLMWAHYADNHRGFAMGIDDAHPVWNERKSSEDDLRHLRKVKYSSLRPSRPMAEYDFEAFILAKGDDWGYEKEWRIGKSLDDAAKRIPSSPFDICLFPLPSTAIRRIYVGARASPALRATLRSLSLQPRYQHLEMLQYQPHESQYGLVAHPFTGI